MDFKPLIEKIIESGELDEDMNGRDWVEFSIVLQFEDEGNLRRTFGIPYDTQHFEIGASVGPWIINNEAQGVEKALRPLSGDVMKQILVQYDRRIGRFKTDFECDDPKRWTVTPDNVEHSVAALRPDWDWLLLQPMNLPKVWCLKEGSYEPIAR